MQRCSLYCCLVLFCCCLTIKAQGQSALTANFTASGTFCSGNTIHFSSTVTGGAPWATGYQYAWDFGGQGASTLANPSFTFNAGSGCGVESFNVSLTVRDQIGNIFTVTQLIDIQRVPDLDFTNTKKEFGNPFQICNAWTTINTIGLALVDAPPDCANSYTYIIDWGDGSPEETVTTMPVAAGDNGIPHTYTALDIYDLTVTIIGPNGCNSIIVRKKVIIMTNSEGSIKTPQFMIGLCAPADTSRFELSDWQGNHRSTTYTVNYGDGSAVTTLTQEYMLLTYTGLPGGNYPVPHVYTEPSCPNEYTITLIMTNICEDEYIEHTTKVKVAIKPVSEFTGPVKACVNTTVTFVNLADEGYTPNCNRTANYTWDFGDGTTAIINGVSTPPPGTHTYTTDGTYTVKLIVANECGRDTSYREICIEPHNTLLFNPGANATGCAPMTVSLENSTSYTSLCSPEAYEWLISYTAGQCGTGSSYTYLSGSDKNTKEPDIRFLNPGSYHIRLAVDNVCMDTSSIQTITVVDRPTVSVPRLTACQTFPNTSFTVNATVRNCAGATSYSWIFPGGTPSTSTAASPVVEYSGTGTRSIGLTIENVCGSATATGSITINTTPSTLSLPDLTLCNGEYVPPIIGASWIPEAPQYSWYNTNPAIGLASTGLSGIPGFTATNTGAVPISGIITVTPRINSCTGSNFSFIITVLPAPKGTITGADTVCVDAPPVELTFTGSNGIPPYTFYYTVDGGSPQSITAPGIGTTATITVPTAVPGIYTYALDSITDVNPIRCVNLLRDTAWVVIVEHHITSHPIDSQKICAGRNIDILRVRYSGPGTPTYQWYKNTTGSTLTGTPIPGSNVADYLPPSSDFDVVGSYYYYVVLTFNYGNCHEVLTSNVAKVEVISMPPVDIEPRLQTVCKDTPADTIKVIDTTNNPYYTYSWYKVDGGSVSISSSSTYDPPTDVVGDHFYYYIVNELYPVCTITSDTAVVKVVPLPSFSTQPQSEDLCEGEAAPTLTIAYQDGTGTPDIQWYESSVNAYTGVAISGATVTNYVPPVTQPGTTYYYCAVVFPDGNCGDITSTIAYVTVHPTPVNTDITIDDVLCYGRATGAITLDNDPAHIYTWTGHNDYTSSQQSIISLYAGTYNVSIRSNAGCTYSDTYTIAEPDDIDYSRLSITPISCYNANDGIVNIEIRGGVAPYTVYWSDLTLGAYKENVLPGSYTVVIVDYNGCSKTTTINMVSPPLFDIKPEVVPVSCYGKNDARIHLNYEGGTAPISCVWDDNPAAGADRIDLPPGTYTVTLTDSRLCYIKKDFEIQELMPLAVSATIENAMDCITDNSGAINPAITGGTAPYTYTWSNGATTQNLSNLNAGNYWIDIIDSHGCTTRGSYVITRPQEITIGVTTKASFSCFDNAPAQAVIASVTGGIAPYTYNWSAGTVINAQGDSMIMSHNGGVLLTVTDWRGCSTQQTFDVSIPHYEIVVTMKDCQSRIYDFEIVVEGDDLFIGTYLWDFGDGETAEGETQTHQFSNPGIYTATLQQIIPGCVITLTHSILVHGPPNIDILPEDARFCEGGSLELTAVGADSYLWNHGTEQENIIVFSTGSYSVRGFTVYGCYSDKEVDVGHFPFYNYRIYSNKKEVTRTDPTVNFWTEDIFNSQYSWFFDGNPFDEHFYNIRHTYNVTEDRMHAINLSVINPHGCLEGDEMTLHANVVLINTFTPNGDGINDVFMQGWRIEVYNRNGQLFFKGLDGWDGTLHGGQPVAKDTYFYLLYDLVEGGTAKHKGYVTILR